MVYLPTGNSDLILILGPELKTIKRPFRGKIDNAESKEQMSL